MALSGFDYKWKQIDCDWVSDCCLATNEQMFGYIMVRVSHIQWNDDDVHFVLDQNTYMYLQVDMLLHSYTLSWFWANSICFLLTAAFLSEKQQIPISYSLIWPDQSSNLWPTALTASTLKKTLHHCKSFHCINYFFCICFFPGFSLIHWFTDTGYSPADWLFTDTFVIVFFFSRIFSDWLVYQYWLHTSSISIWRHTTRLGRNFRLLPLSWHGTVYDVCWLEY